ncbi:uncharacterized protein K02A2.6-like [Haliotis rufescens]|uniref:uncharacterized protein K02A2.6-like n=1 Tax=Haliotis rufescens TaxID=6454 RepID=UPI00201EC9D6|nr:uncharacterized protein K02A2.6-like [Haliotis rufescens]
MKTLEDILPSLSKARYFTKLDARSGYWAIRLAEESSFLTTFNTPYGRYRFLRLPFGIRSAQDEFQRRIDECYEGLDGVAAIVDDVLVYGSTPEEHDHNLRNMLSRSRDKGIKLNEEKLEVGVTEIQYFGHILSAEGLRPDPAKVSAICSMNPPRDRSELETILGMVNYLAKFAPNLSEITSPLRQLLPKDVEFVWDHPQSTAFQRIKDIITQTPGQVLAYYDPDKDLTLQVDASKYGLGAALLQDGKPVTYASKSLTTTEVNYAQIEKEMFAILFGCKRFHQYVYGRHVKVESDHKPLISIMKKPLAVAPARLQRMMLQLQKYDLTVEHRPGKEIVVADTLSRKSVPDTYPHLSEGMDAHVHMIVSNVPVSEKRMEDIRRATEADPQFSLLQQTIIDGWPEHRKLCPGTILEFWNFRDQLAFMDGIIFKGQKIVIPKSLRTSMLDKIHTGHMGVEKCLRRARDILFWPKMSNDITSLVLNCSVCLERRNSNPKEPLISHDIPSRPWQTVATDLFLWDTHDFVVVVDYYSRYFEVCKLPSTKSTTVINALKDVFARHGIPDKVISDNGPQYSSQDFAQFAEKWDFVHETSSPRYAQSNGLAEKTVQTIKRIFSKAKTDGRDPHIGILEYRTTPMEANLSPSQLLMGRRLRSTLPCTQHQLLPGSVDHSQYQKVLQASRRKQKHYYDTAAKPLLPLKTGEAIRVRQHNNLWTPAVVTKQHNSRSYTVRTGDGAEYRRNRRHLLRTREKHDIPEMNIDVTSSELPHVPQTDRADTCTRDTAEVKPSDDPVTSPIPSRTHSPQKVIDNANNQYITRSGRVVKPKVIASV